MNISPSLSALKSCDEATQLLAIMQDCGVDQIWKNQELRLLVVYLENTLGEQTDIRHDVTSSVFLYLVKKIFRSREFWELGIERHVLHWFLRFADGSHLKEALCASVIGRASVSSIRAHFDSNHLAFKRDEDEFKKISMLMMLEGFPAHWHTEHSPFGPARRSRPRGCRRCRKPLHSPASRRGVGGGNATQAPRRR